MALTGTSPNKYAYEMGDVVGVRGTSTVGTINARSGGHYKLLGNRCRWFSEAELESAECKQPVTGRHYDIGGIETISFIKAKLTPEEFKGFLLGNIIKYSSRMSHKHNDGGVQDSKKLSDYSKRLEEFLNETK